MSDIKKAAGQTAASENTRPNDTKRAKIEALLRAGITLNRFEAEQYGDHTLNSTVAVLRAKGMMLVGSWEKVPSRFSVKKVRVLRYRYIGSAV